MEHLFIKQSIFLNNIQIVKRNEALIMLKVGIIGLGGIATKSLFTYRYGDARQKWSGIFIP